MDAHENARTTPHSRRLIVRRLQQGQSVTEVAASLGVTSRTVRKWRDRFAAEGEAGLRDRSSRPHHSPSLLGTDQHAAIEGLRRQRLSGPAIARRLGLPISTVGAALRRLGLNRLAALDPRPPVIRYERDHPGELIHIDIKKLGRIDGLGHRITGDRHGQSNKRGVGQGPGWEYVHVAVDDRSRLAYTELLPDERKHSAIGFTRRAFGVVRKPWCAHRARHDRQRLRLQKLRLPRAARRARRASQAHQALHAAHQRQGRALHPDLLARMGLCAPLPKLR
jgi:transposase